LTHLPVGCSTPLYITQPPSGKTTSTVLIGGDDYAATEKYHIGLAKPLAGLKRLASFGAWGGVVHDWCKPGVWPFFVHRLAGVGKPLFWCQISIFW